ncbi:MAG: hypothetical protein AABX11_04695 [Nanoarchaeota archaeon]
MQQIAFLKTVVNSIAGSGSAAIVDLLFGKKNVNEFLIAKKLKLTINQARNILYKLGDAGLVSFVRKKDSKKGGWYTYFWTLNVARGLGRYMEILNKEVDVLKSRANTKKQSRFYICKNCHIEFDEENALLHNYSCPECGEVLEVKDTTEEVLGIEKEIGKLESSIGKINGELVDVQAEEAKARNRKSNAADKKKKQERDLKRKARQKEKKKLLEKSPAKKGKKKK